VTEEDDWARLALFPLSTDGLEKLVCCEDEVAFIPAENALRIIHVERDWGL